MTLACGIDFGTSNSAIGLCDAGRPHLLPIQHGATSVPTALFFSFDDNSTTFGQITSTASGVNTGGNGGMRSFVIDSRINF